MARTFNGSSQHGTIATSTSNNPTDLTASIWLFIPSDEGLSTGNRRIFEIAGFGSGGDGVAVEWQASTDTLIGIVWDGGTSNNIASTTSWSKGVWNHLCITSRSTTSALHRFFINGVKIGSDQTTNLRAGSTQSIGVARRNTVASELLEGRLAEFSIFDTNLSDANVALLAGGDSPYAVDEASLVRYWRMDGAAGTEDDLIASATLTYTGSPGTETGPTVDDPPASGASIPILARYYAQMRNR